jgi:WD40 repeat protein
MWETDTKKEVRNFIGHTDIISSIQLSNDQKSLLSSSWDGTVRIWDVGTGLMAKKFKGHVGAVHSSIFSADGKFVYSAEQIAPFGFGTSLPQKWLEPLKVTKQKSPPCC